MSRRVARPYAAALFQVVGRQGVSALREVEHQLQTVVELHRALPELLRSFEVPGVAPAARQKLLGEVGRALALRVETQRLLAALAQHYRLRFLPEVVAAFRGLVDRREGIVRGRVDAPVAPSKEQMTALAAALGVALKARVELAAEVKEELLAGFVVQVGSQVFDGSLRTQLRRFARGGAAR